MSLSVEHLMSYRRRYRYRNTYDEGIREIAEKVEDYNDLWEDASSAPLGSYSPHAILTNAEEGINYMESVLPRIRDWAYQYLEAHRGELWLRHGLFHPYMYHNTSYTQEERRDIWPFLYRRNNPEYKGFILDEEEADRENKRQKERRFTHNPRTVHTCRGGLICFICDDGNWQEEDNEERNASRNIFFNTSLQHDFYKAVLPDLENLKEQWATWRPKRCATTRVVSPKTSRPDTAGKTKSQVAHWWVKEDLHYSGLFTIFRYGDVFDSVWENMNILDDTIQCLRTRLALIRSILDGME